MFNYAQMMRDFKDKDISLEMIEFHGKNEIPSKSKGIRKITKVQTRAIYVLREDGKESWLELANTKLIDYDSEYLMIYGIGKRNRTEEENRIANEWKAITETSEYKKI